MNPPLSNHAIRLLRMISLVLLAALGTMALMRFAPGYFTDAREMDSRYGDTARSSLKDQESKQGKLLPLMKAMLAGWVHGDLGRSRQYDVQVTELIKPRLEITGKLLFSGISCGWLFACALALPLSARRGSRGEALIAAPTALLLSIPIGAMATVCVIANKGGALAVLSTVIAVRDFKLVYKLLSEARKAPALLFARAQGISSARIVSIYLLPPLASRLLALALLSFVTALSAIVPLEVVFDVPGLGHLAWSAAMNRDLPVLLVVTLLMAAAIGMVSMFSEAANQEAML